MYLLYLLCLFCSFLGLFLRFSPRSCKLLSFLWFIFFVFLGTFAFFTDDYEAYEEIVERAYVDPFAYFSVEPCWIWFMDLVKGEVTEFRFCSFLLLSGLLVGVIKISKVRAMSFLAFYTLFCMSAHLCWIRQPVAYCFFALALLCLLSNKQILGLILIIVGIYSHKSSILLLVICPFVFIPLNRKMVTTICLILSPILYLVFFSILKLVENYLGIGIDFFLDADNNEYLSRHWIFQLLNISVTILQILTICKTLLLFNGKEAPIDKALVRALFGILYVSLLLLLLPIESNVISKRLLAFGCFIMAILWGRNFGELCYGKSFLTVYIFIVLWVLLRETSVVLNNYTRWYKLFMLPDFG